MAKVKNNSQVVVTVVTGVKDGEAQTASIRPGATEDINLDMDHERTKQLLHVGAISVEGHRAAAATPRKKAE